jgi:hypothetical protein
MPANASALLQEMLQKSWGIASQDETGIKLRVVANTVTTVSIVMMIVSAAAAYQAVLDRGVSCLIVHQCVAIPVQWTLPHALCSEVATPCESLHPWSDEPWFLAQRGGAKAANSLVSLAKPPGYNRKLLICVGVRSAAYPPGC